MCCGALTLSSAQVHMSSFGEGEASDQTAAKFMGQKERRRSSALKVRGPRRAFAARAGGGGSPLAMARSADADGLSADVPRRLPQPRVQAARAQAHAQVLCVPPRAAYSPSAAVYTCCARVRLLLGPF